jgi:hypothetical protein
MSVDGGTRVSRPARGQATAFLGLGLALLAGSALAQSHGRPLGERPVVAAEANRVPPDRTESLRRNIIADKPVWKRITLGTYKGVHTVRQALEAAQVRIGDSANEILGRPAFFFSRTRTDVDLIVVSVADLGFAGTASLSDIHRRANELGLELCPAEVAPLLRLQYASRSANSSTLRCGRSRPMAESSSP